MTTTVAPQSVSAPSTHALTLSGVVKTFGAVTAVRGLDLSVGRGEVVAFLGPNGAGKTTTIDLLLGLSSPTAGTVEVFGLEPHEAVRRGLVAAVMQTGGLLKDLTVRETVEYTASLFAHAAPVSEVLRSADLEALADRRVGLCSGGEQQRLRFAMALVSDPALIMLDEPTTGMDVTTRRTFWQSIRQDAAQGRTVLFATHYLEEADAYADRIVMVRHGQVVADGTPAEIRALGTGRSIRINWPGVTASDLQTIPGVTSTDVRGEQVLLHTNDSDATARHLLTRTAATDLEITARGIEDAFMALTTDHA